MLDTAGDGTLLEEAYCAATGEKLRAAWKSFAPGTTQFVGWLPQFYDEVRGPVGMWRVASVEPAWGLVGGIGGRGKEGSKRGGPGGGWGAGCVQAPGLVSRFPRPPFLSAAHPH